MSKLNELEIVVYDIDPEVKECIEIFFTGIIDKEDYICEYRKTGQSNIISEGIKDCNSIYVHVRVEKIIVNHIIESLFMAISQYAGLSMQINVYDYNYGKSYTYYMIDKLVTKVESDYNNPKVYYREHKDKHNAIIRYLHKIFIHSKPSWNNLLYHILLANSIIDGEIISNDDIDTIINTYLQNTNDLHKSKMN